MTQAQPVYQFQIDSEDVPLVRFELLEAYDKLRDVQPYTAGRLLQMAIQVFEATAGYFPADQADIAFWKESLIRHEQRQRVAR